VTIPSGTKFGRYELRSKIGEGGMDDAGTLTRMPVDSGAVRHPLEDGQEADWSPDRTKLAVARWVKGRDRLEYHVGILYETAGYISHPRISPKGDRLWALNNCRSHL
jgi:hypothetical protein